MIGAERVTRGSAFGIGVAMQARMGGTDSKTVHIAGIEGAIGRIRGQNVMLDADLAQLYGVNTRELNQAVQRNLSRFPSDFMFRLTADEAQSLRSQSVILDTPTGQPGAALRSQSVISNRRGGRRYRPYAFTEQGVAMLSSVLRSRKAIAVNIEIMRAFVALRRLLDSDAGLARKLEELERRYDGQFKVVFAAIRALMNPPTKPRKRIGFNSVRTESE